MKTLRISIMIAAMFCLAVTAAAQSYAKMWKQVETFAGKDLPKSALAEVKQIEAKALNEGNDVQLLRALLMQRVYGGSLSPDSAKTYTARLEAGLQREKQPVMQCLWQSALAQCYLLTDGADFRGDEGAERRAKAKRAFEVSLSNLDSLAQAKTHDYLPLFEEEKGSRTYFADDLLHVLFNACEESGVWTKEERTAWLRRMEQFYDGRGMHDASVHFALRRLEVAYGSQTVKGNIEDDAHFLALDSLSRSKASVARADVFRQMTQLPRWQGGDEAQTRHNDSVLYRRIKNAVAELGRGKQTAALQNFLEQMTVPSIRLSGLPEQGLGGQHTELTLTARNVTATELRVTRLFADRRDYENCDKDKLADLAAKQKKTAEKIIFNFPSNQPYEWTACDTAWTLPQEPGIYYAELFADGKRLDAAVFGVSNLTAVTFVAAGKTRVTAVDAQSGKSVAGATVTAYKRGGNANAEWRQVRATHCDENGTAELQDRQNEYVRYAVTTAADKASQWFAPSRVRAYGTGDEKARTEIQVYTDRAVYRPGQKVQFTATVFTRRGDDCHTESGYEAVAQLRDVNYKAVDSLLVCTDDFGTLHGELSLPESCLTGTFTLAIASKSLTGTKRIKVEEYKRPTFAAETSPLKLQYALGDTVQVEGTAQTYAGVPVTNARVQYEVRRTAWLYGRSDEQEAQTGETTTGDDGTFRIPVVLKGDNETDGNAPFARYNRYTYEVSFTVTAENGETAQGSTAVSAANRPYCLKATVPDVVYLYKGKELPTLLVEKLNAQGQNLPQTGEYSVIKGQETVVQGTFQTGVGFLLPELSSLGSGKYQFAYRTTAEDADTTAFTLLREDDTHPADTAHTWFFHQESTAAQDTVHIVFGTNQSEAVVFYDLIAGDRTVETKRIVLHNEWRHIVLTYDTIYGDGAMLSLAMVSGGKLYTATASVKRPLPDKRLKLEWTSFRSRLTPGSSEEWRVKVTRPDGRPARAQMAACLYDASLDAFAANVWDNYQLYFPRRLPSTMWQGGVRGYSRQMSGQCSAKYRTVPTVSFTHWQSSLFGEVWNVFPLRRRLFGRVGAMMYADVATMNLADTRAKFNDVEIPVAERNATAADETTVRKDFNETAYFAPALMTDSDGEVTMRFTLPESVTKWNFTALAHDTRMNSGRIDTAVVAKKEFMVESALPRFLRSGDKAVLPVKVTNLSDKPLATTVTLTLTNAEDGKTVCQSSKRVDVAAGANILCTFCYDTADFEGVLVCRTVGKGNGFSDGEERYLPVLTGKTTVVRALPFALTESGKTVLRVDTLMKADATTHPSLHVEVTSNPAWHAVNSLPVLMQSNSCLSATQWATRLYALGLGSYVAQKNPEIRNAVTAYSNELQTNAALATQGLTDATPWLREGMADRERAKALAELFDESTANVKLHTALAKLGNLQDNEGAYAWFPGMKGNRWVTMEVATLLARMERLTDNTASHAQLEKAMDYLAKEISQSVEAMKKETRQQPTEFQLRYLNLYTLTDGQKDNADVKFLLRRAEELNKELTLYGKAQTALVMARNGKTEVATELVNSLLEYTETTQEMGRYFDTPRTRMLTNNDKIHVQCAAVEALHLTGHKAESEEMRLWLMQTNRTQTWRTSQATADAVYALLLSDGDGTQLVQPLSQTEPVYFTLVDGKGKIIGFNASRQSETPHTTGYFKQSYTGNDALQAKHLKLDKRTDGLSWGCVYATYVTNAENAVTEGTGIQLRCAYEVKRGTAWQPLAQNELLTKGDHVRRVFTLVADRDYDFVQLRAARPACLEPAQPLSGYDWRTGMPAYRAVKDTETVYYIEHLGKGEHRMEEELFADKAGTYGTGVSRAECVNAPEFGGTAQGAMLHVAE